MPGMTDRDTFAYAALAGRFTDFDAFEIADAMLRERCRSGGDCPLPDNAANHDAAPAARAESDEDRTDKAATSHRRDGTGDTQRPVAYGVLRLGGRWVSILDNALQAETSRQSWDRMENWVHEVIPLYRQPPCQDFSQQNLTLTDAEREAVEQAVGVCELDATDERCQEIAATLRGLLERLG